MIEFLQAQPPSVLTVLAEKFPDTCYFMGAAPEGVDLKDFETHKAAFEEKLAHQALSASSATEALKRLGAQFQKLTTMLETITKALTAKQAEVTELKAEVAALKGALHAAQEAATKAERESKRLLKQEKGQQFELREATEEIARLKAVIDGLSAQRVVLSKSTPGQTAVAGSAGDAWVRDDKSAVTIKDMQKRLDEASQALAKVRQENEGLRGELAQTNIALKIAQGVTKIETDRFKMQEYMLEQQAERRECLLAQKTKELQVSQEKVEQLSRRLAELEQQCAEEQAAHERALGEATDSNMELNTRNEEMGGKLRRMMTALHLQSEVATLTEKKLKQANKRVLDEMGQLNVKIAAMKEEVRDAQEQLDSSQARIAEMEKEVADAREQLRLSQTQVAEMKKEVASAPPPPPPWEGGSLQFLRAYGGLFPPAPAPPAPLSQSSLLTTGTLAAPFPGTAPPQQHPSVYPPTGTPLPPSTYNCYRPGG